VYEIPLRLSRRDVGMLLAMLSTERDMAEQMMEDSDMGSQMLAEAGIEFEESVRAQVEAAVGKEEAEDLEEAVQQVYGGSLDAVMEKWKKGEFP
jgi:hypothetical protein